MQRNRKPFLERWGKRLELRPIVGSGAPWPRRLVALRDAIAVIRILVLYDSGLAHRLSALWPGARITLSGSAANDGIEQAPDERADLGTWLEERRFHYSVVVSQERPHAGLARALGRSQAQAPVVAVGDEDDEAIIERLARVGIAPPMATPRG